MSVPDEVAFEAFYAQHRRHVVAYCRRRAAEPDALEAADETFLVAWRRWNQIPPAAVARPWLYGVARRVLANQFRGDRRRRRLVTKLGTFTTPSPASPEAAVVRTDEDGRLLAAFQRLRPEDQEVLRLIAWEGLSHDEIGVVLDCTANTSRQRVHRARRRLARELEPRTIGGRLR